MPRTDATMEESSSSESTFAATASTGAYSSSDDGGEDMRDTKDANATTKKPPLRQQNGRAKVDASGKPPSLVSPPSQQQQQQQRQQQQQQQQQQRSGVSNSSPQTQKGTLKRAPPSPLDRADVKHGRLMNPTTAGAPSSTQMGIHRHPNGSVTRNGITYNMPQQPSAASLPFSAPSSFRSNNAGSSSAAATAGMTQGLSASAQTGNTNQGSYGPTGTGNPKSGTPAAAAAPSSFAPGYSQYSTKLNSSARNFSGDGNPRVARRFSGDGLATRTTNTNSASGENTMILRRYSDDGMGGSTNNPNMMAVRRFSGDGTSFAPRVGGGGGGPMARRYSGDSLNSCGELSATRTGVARRYSGDGLGAGPPGGMTRRYSGDGLGPPTSITTHVRRYSGDGLPTSTFPAGPASMPAYGSSSSASSMQYASSTASSTTSTASSYGYGNSNSAAYGSQMQQTQQQQQQPFSGYQQAQQTATPFRNMTMTSAATGGSNYTSYSRQQQASSSSLGNTSYGTNNESRERGPSPAARSISPPNTIATIADSSSLRLHFGHPKASRIVEGRSDYTTKVLIQCAAHTLTTSVVGGNEEEGCDSLLVDNPATDRDNLCIFEFRCLPDRKPVLWKSLKTKRPIRVFRKEDPSMSGYRYDGLFTVIAVMDMSRKFRAELPKPSSTIVLFVLERCPAGRAASLMSNNNGYQYTNEMQPHDLWGIVAGKKRLLRATANNNTSRHSSPLLGPLMPPTGPLVGNRAGVAAAPLSGPARRSPLTAVAGPAAAARRTSPLTTTNVPRLPPRALPPTAAAPSTPATRPNNGSNNNTKNTAST